MKKKGNKNKIFTLKETIVLTLISNILIFVTIGIILYNNYEKNAGISYNHITEDKNLQEFLTVYDSIVNNYYQEVDKEEILNTAISSMLTYLDDNYTSYIDENQNAEISDILGGEYIGIGISITNDNIIKKVYKDTPADAAGFKENDKIIKIDDLDLTNENSTKLKEYLKSKQNQDVTINILRDEQTISITLKPTNIALQVVEHAVIENNSKKIGYLSISTFSINLVDQVISSLNDLEGQNIESLIIDLRNNSGGILNSTKEVANLFLEKNKIIYSLESKTKTTKYKDETEESKKYPIVVLVNNNTASAAEILAAALKDSYGATLVGQKTYGKGKVQQILSLSNGSAVKYTSAKWLTPNNKCIDKIGITPDYIVENKYYDETKTYVDNQLEKAIEILSV